MMLRSEGSTADTYSMSRRLFLIDSSHNLSRRALGLLRILGYRRAVLHVKSVATLDDHLGRDQSL